MVGLAARDVLDTSRPDAARRWDNLLTLQVDLFYPHELDALQESQPWRRARNVLDVGCGNGRFVSRLSDAFPGKRFVGIDKSAELIAAANATCGLVGLRFERRDFLSDDLGRQFDAVLFRFVVQYLSDFPALLDHTARHVGAGGAAIIIEPELRESRLYPECPLFTGMLEAFETQQDGMGRMRGRLADLPAIANSRGWHVQRNTGVSVPVIGHVNGSVANSLFSHWLDLCECGAGLRHDFVEIRRELDNWVRHPAASAKIALRMLELVRERTTLPTSPTTAASARPHCSVGRPTPKRFPGSAS